jgi:hypothetical protein
VPVFSLTLSFGSDQGSNQKEYWERVVQDLRERGAHILEIQSKVGKVGDPLATLNVVTIRYEAPNRINYPDKP